MQRGGLLKCLNVQLFKCANVINSVCSFLYLQISVNLCKCAQMIYLVGVCWCAAKWVADLRSNVQLFECANAISNVHKCLNVQICVNLCKCAQMIYWVGVRWCAARWVADLSSNVFLSREEVHTT